jgi:hypothetical protein
MRHRRVIILALALNISLQAAAADTPATKTWPCYWRGRIWTAQGTPSIRVWPVGTRRILGIVNPNPGVIDYEGADAIPDSVSDVLTEDVAVYGNYHICPIAPERRGWMRFVFIDKVAGKLVVRSRN